MPLSCGDCTIEHIFLVTVFGYHLPARCVFPLTQTCEFICVQQPIIKYRSSDFVTCTWHTYMEYLTDQFMLCVTDVREGIKLGVVSSLWCQVSKFCEVFLSCDGKLGLQLNSKWLKVRAWLCYWNLNLLCIPNDMRLIYRSQHKKMVLTFLSSLSVSLPVSTAGFHQHSQGDLWEDPGGSVWYQQWGEILCSSCVGFFFLPEPPSLFFVLLFPSPLLPQCGFAAVCVVCHAPSLSKRRGKKPSTQLPLTAAKQNSQCSSSPLLYFPHTLSSLLSLRSLPVSVSLSHSLCLSLGILPAHKFLTSHKVSVIGQENKHSASQSDWKLPIQPNRKFVNQTLRFISSS